MRKLVKKILLLLVTLVIANFVFLLIISLVPVPKPYMNIGKIPPGERGHSLQRFREIGEFNNVDVLCVGSSTCYQSFDPRIFSKKGLTCFNMGSINQTPLNTYYLLEEYVDQLNPRYILFDVSFGTLNNSDGLEGFADLVVNLPYSNNLVEMGIATGQPYAVNTIIKEYCVTSLFSPHDQRVQNEIDNEEYISGGFVENKSLQTDDLSSIAPVTLIFSDDQKEYILKIINLANKKGMKLIMVTQPMPKEIKQSIIGYNDLCKTLSDLAQSNGIRYINFNDYLTFDSMNDFFDQHHLNNKGVAKYNEFLLKEVFDK